MSDTHPYTPPQAPLEEDLPPTELAGRGTRLAAALIDSLILGALVLIIFFLVHASQGIDLEQVSQLTDPGRRLFEAATVVASEGLFALLNLHLLQVRGQTIGKWFLKIRIVRMSDGRIPSLKDIYFKRHLVPRLVAWAIPFGGLVALLDALSIFRDSRRCLHDEFAGTIVVLAK